MQLAQIPLMNGYPLLQAVHSNTPPGHIGQPGLDFNPFYRSFSACGEQHGDYPVPGTQIQHSAPWRDTGEPGKQYGIH
ncbi:hypothetical protein D3C81_1914970 [compost metagenome]